MPSIQAIYAHHVLHGLASFEETPPDLSEITRRFRALRAGGFPYLAAALEGQVVGYAYAGPYRPRPAYRFVREGSLQHVTDAGLCGATARRRERLDSRLLLGCQRHIHAWHASPGFGRGQGPAQPSTQIGLDQA